MSNEYNAQSQPHHWMKTRHETEVKKVCVYFLIFILVQGEHKHLSLPNLIYLSSTPAHYLSFALQAEGPDVSHPIPSF